MRHEFVELILWKRLADDHLLYGKSDQHQLRRQQHVELGGNRSDEYRDRAGDIYIHVGKRFNQREPNRDDHLHADSNQYRGVGDVYADRHRRHDQQADDHLFYSQPLKYHFRFEQHAGLGDERGNEYCHHAGNFHVYVRKRFDEREPNRDDYLHADRNQCLRLGHILREGNRRSIRRSVDDRNHFVPRRNPRRGICRVHNRRQRWLSALHLLRKHEFQLSSIT